MTMLAAEAGSAAAEAGAAESTAGASRAFASRRPPAGRSSGKVFPITNVRSPQRAPGSRSRGRQRQSPGFADVRRATSGIKPGTPDVPSYEMAILAEFVAAVLLTAATPFARPNQPGPGLSPYAGRDMIQLLALTVVYFILALLAGTQQSTARLAAWFGALVLLTVGLGEAAALAKLFGGGLTPAPPLTPEQAAAAGAVSLPGPAL